ncbi:hypothetical protein GOODEAATRI_030564, partial [Goodea atripinnis]
IVAPYWSQWQPLQQEGSDNFLLVSNVPEEFRITGETTFLCEEGVLYTLTSPKMSQGCTVSVEEVQSWWEVPAIAHFCSLFRTAFRLPDFEIEVRVCLRRLAATRMSFNTEMRTCLCQHFCLRDGSAAFGTAVRLTSLWRLLRTSQTLTAILLANEPASSLAKTEASCRWCFQVLKAGQVWFTVFKSL